MLILEKKPKIDYEDQFDPYQPTNVSTPIQSCIRYRVRGQWNISILKI